MAKSISANFNQTVRIRRCSIIRCVRSIVGWRSWLGGPGRKVGRQILLQVSALTIFIRPREGRHFTA